MAPSKYILNVKIFTSNHRLAPLNQMQEEEKKVFKDYYDTKEEDTHLFVL